MENSLIILVLLFAAQGAVTFEVASIRPSAPGTKDVADTHPGGVFVGRHVTTRFLVGIAYGQKAMALVGERSWFDDFYDIDAKAPGSGEMTTPELAIPLQALLGDRFGLVTHDDMKQQTIYSLERDKSKLKLTPSTSNDWPTYQRTGTTWVAHNQTMAALADTFAASFDIKAPVIDHTRLDGKYDFVLDYATDTARFSTFEAARSIGLVLRQQKAMAPVLVIDRIHKPTPD